MNIENQETTLEAKNNTILTNALCAQSLTLSVWKVTILLIYSGLAFVGIGWAFRSEEYYRLLFEISILLLVLLVSLPFVRFNIDQLVHLFSEKECAETLRLRVDSQKSSLRRIVILYGIITFGAIFISLSLNASVPRVESFVQELKKSEENTVVVSYTEWAICSFVTIRSNSGTKKYVGAWGKFRPTYPSSQTHKREVNFKKSSKAK